MSSLTATITRSPRLLAIVQSPEWAAAQLGRATGTAHLRTLTAAPSGDLAGQVRAQLEAGNPPGTTLSKALSAAAANAYARQAEIALIEGLVREFTNDLDMIAAEALPRIITNLDIGLQDALDQAAELGGITTADQAIEAGRADDWTKLKDAHAVYLQTRADHAQILVEVDATLMGAAMRSHLLFGNVAGTWPQWLASTGNISRAPRAALGWSVLAHSTPWPEDITSIDHFTYVVANRADLLPRITDAKTIRAEWDTDRLKAHADARAAAGDSTRSDRNEAKTDALLASHARAAANRAESAYQDSVTYNARN